MTVQALSTNLSISAQPSSEKLNLEVQPAPSENKYVVKWGGREYRIDVVQISEQGEEAVLSLSDIEMEHIIEQLQLTLPKMQRPDFEPSQLHRIELIWRCKIEKEKPMDYSFKEVCFIREGEQIRKKAPTIIDGIIAPYYEDFKPLSALFTEKLTSPEEQPKAIEPGP